MADIHVLKLIYRRLAANKAADPKGPSEQIAWLTDTFINHATSEDGGESQVTSDSFDGGSTAIVFRGSTAFERSQALDQLLTELEHQAAGTVDLAKPAWLTPRFFQLPR